MSVDMVGWLQSQGVLGKFRRNYLCSIHRLSLRAYISKVPPDELLRSAFIWQDAPEGNVYWNNINKNYMRWIKKHKKEESEDTTCHT